MSTLNYFQALRVIRGGKKTKTSREDLLAAAKTVNAFRNRNRIRRLRRLGYADDEIQDIIYASPATPPES
jgi:hypothetical protein